jgi:hypothetical protein
MDDGGLAAAREGIVAAREAQAQRSKDRDEAVERALREHGLRIEQALEAFFDAAKSETLMPERFHIGDRAVGPKPRARFGRDKLGYWGMRDRPAPTEPICKLGFVIDTWRQVHEAHEDRQRVIVWSAEEAQITSETVQLTDERRYKDALPTNPYRGVLRFHLSPRGYPLRPGSVPDGDAKDQVAAIRITADWFVARLAAYLESGDPAE